MLQAEEVTMISSPLWNNDVKPFDWE